jgi:uncharacterized integral membrane protein
MNNNKKTFETRFLKLFLHNDESYTKSWEKQKKNGVLYFFIVNTALAVLTFVILSFITLNVKGNFFGWERSAAVATASIIGLIAGIIASTVKWLIGESRYHNIKNK